MDEKEFLRQLNKLVKMLTGEDVAIRHARLYSTKDVIFDINERGFQKW